MVSPRVPGREDLHGLNYTGPSSVSISIPPSSVPIAVHAPQPRYPHVYNTRRSVRSGRGVPNPARSRECYYSGRGHHHSPPSSLYNVYTPSNSAAAVAAARNVLNNNNSSGNIMNSIIHPQQRAGSENPPLPPRHIHGGTFSTYMNYGYNIPTNVSSSPTDAVQIAELSRIAPGASSTTRRRIIQQVHHQPQQRNNNSRQNNNSPLRHHAHRTSGSHRSNGNGNSNPAASSFASMDIPAANPGQQHQSYMLRSRNTPGSHAPVNMHNDYVPLTQLSQESIAVGNTFSHDATFRPITARSRIVTRSQNNADPTQRSNTNNTNNSGTSTQITETTNQTPDNQISNSNLNRNSDTLVTTNTNATTVTNNISSTSPDCGGASSRRSRGNNPKSKKMNAAQPKTTTKKKIDYKQLYPTKDSVDVEIHTCPICIEEIATNDLTTISGCAHKFCFPCIEKWADRENTCPLCKSRFHRIDRVNRAPPNKKRKSSGGNATSTPRTKNTKKIKNRDQRADISSGNPLQGLFASMEANGHVPQALTQIIFSSALSSRSGLVPFATGAPGNSGAVSAGVGNNEQFRRVSRYATNRFARSRANGSTNATAASATSSNNGGGQGPRRMYPPSSEAFALTFGPNGNRSALIDTTTNNSNSSTRQGNSRQQQLQQQSQHRASEMLQQPLFQVQSPALQQSVQNLLFRNNVSNFHNFEDDIEFDQEYNSFVSGLHFEPMVLPSYNTRNMGRSYAANVHNGGETADTALEIEDSDEEDNDIIAGDDEVEFVE